MVCPIPQGDHNYNKRQQHKKTTAYMKRHKSKPKQLIARTDKNVCITVHNCTYTTAMNSSDNLPSYPLHIHHRSDVAYWRRGEA